MTKEEEFLGLTKKGAQNLAEKKNLIFRLIEVNGESFFAEPTDKVTDRICVWITNSVVSKVVFT